MPGGEVFLYWLAVTVYAAAGVAYLVGLVFQRRDWVDRATMLVAANLVPHGIAILWRWNAVGHGPYINRYEVFSSDVWVAMAAFVAVQLRFPRLRLAGAALLPLSFLLMGLGALSSPEPEPLPPSLRSYWLVIHVAFAKLTFAAILIAFGLAVLYLRKARRMGTAAPNGTAGGNGFWDRLPSLERMDDLSYRFLGLGFLLLAIMIAAGSVWAHEAWGNYWSWDPIETWSLITWLTYGIYLHLRTTFAWKGSKASWFTIGAMAVSLVAFFGVAYVARSLHVEYLVR